MIFILFGRKWRFYASDATLVRGFLPVICFTFDMHDHCRSFNAASNNTRSWLPSNVIQQEFLSFFSYSILACHICRLTVTYRSKYSGYSKLQFRIREKNFTSNYSGRFLQLQLFIHRGRTFLSTSFWSSELIKDKENIESWHANVDEIYGKCGEVKE